MLIFIWSPQGLQFIIKISEDATLADLDNEIRSRYRNEDSFIRYSH